MRARRRSAEWARCKREIPLRQAAEQVSIHTTLSLQLKNIERISRANYA